MGRVGKKRKRYVLFTLGSEPSSEIREEFTRLLFKRYPALSKTAVVWLTNGVILRADIASFKEMREEVPQLHLGDFRVNALSSSGSISKLKRLAGGSLGRDEVLH